MTAFVSLHVCHGWRSSSDANYTAIVQLPSTLSSGRAGAFAVDQQPYMQGYLAVSLMVKYLETSAIPGGGQIIRTGPRLSRATRLSG